MTIQILVATDGSEVSREAVRFATRLAKALGGGLVLVHVVSPSANLEEAEALLRAAKADAAAGSVPVKTRVEVGAPAESILRIGRETGADMLIVGTHGRKGVARLFLGSIAESLAKSAPVPVAVVRTFDQTAGDMGPLLVPTDFSEGAAHAARAAAVLARKLGSRLVLLHVLPEVVPPKGEDDPAVVRRETDRLRREAAARLRSAGDALGLDRGQMEVSLVTGVDVAEIVHVAKAIRASCIVMGTRGLTGLPRILLGSVTDQVLRQAPCPVLVIPPGITASRGWWHQAGDAGKGR
jgi:nucleotide-binding universal stress UspA family protein